MTKPITDGELAKVDEWLELGDPLKDIWDEEELALALRERLRLAEAVVEAANSADHLIRQHLGPFASPILDALTAYREACEENEP